MRKHFLATFLMLLCVSIVGFSGNQSQENKRIIEDFESKINKFLANGNKDSAEYLITQLNQFSTTKNDKYGLGISKHFDALVQINAGRLNLALNYLFDAIKYFQHIGSEEHIEKCEFQIGVVHYLLKDFTKALNYFEKIVIKVSNENLKARTQYLMGLCLTELNRNEDAENMLSKALESYKIRKLYKNQAECQVALADLYVRNNQNDKARIFYENALYYFNSNEEDQGIAISYYGLGKIKLLDTDFSEALNLTKKAFSIADSINSFRIKEKSALQLSEIYENIGFYDSAFTYLNIYYQTRDTILSSDNLTAMSVLESELKLTQKQTEMELIKKQRQVDRFIIVAGILGLLLLIIVSASVYKMYKTEKKSRDLINIEKEKSDHLLLNILPKETSEELKEFGKTKARRYDNATVLFADIKGFTIVSEQVSPEKVVELIDQYFCAFDVICEKYKIEKIKTIGDAYLCVGGLPNPKNGKPKDVIMAACEMQKVVLDINNNKSEDEPKFEIRVGLHTGSVVAGVVGKIKFAYDIWGDTVNTAARMEQSSVPGKINVSGVTYELTKNDFNFTYRGKIEAKNKGEIDMYFVNFEA